MTSFDPNAAPPGPPPQQPPPPPQAPGQAGYPQLPPYGYYQAPASASTNGFAIASLVCAFLCSPLGLIFGLVARSQIQRTGEGGHGLATAGIVVSAVFLALSVAYVVLIFTVIGTHSFVVTPAPAPFPTAPTPPF